MNESRELARFVSELNYESLPDEVIARTKDLVLDQVGIMIACATLPWSKIVYEYVHAWGDCKQESSIAYYGDKTKAENAAFANSSFGHGFEIDDHYMPGMSHPGCIAVPSALAMGERESISGKELILAVVAGYEVMGRINKAIAPSCSSRGFHAHTSISGPFGAAAVTGKILGLDPGVMLNALAIAGSHSSGTTEYSHGGGSVKRMHAGIAAHGGLRSALIAQQGLTGPSTILEGKRGFCQAFADEYNLSEITDNLGREFKVVMGQGFKAYCACGAMHTGLDALRNLVSRHDIKSDEVSEIIMGTNSYYLSHISAKPTDITSAQFSGPFGLALLLVTGSNGFQDYTETNLRDPKILALASRIRMEVDPELQGEYPAKRGARITVKLKSGASYQERVDYCKGLPENPMSRKEFEAKFRGLALVVADKDRTEEILKMVYGLENLRDVSVLMPLLSNAN